MCPKNVKSHWLNWHLNRFSFNPDRLTACRTSIVFFSNSSGVSAKMIMMLSCAFGHPSMDSMIAAMRAWHTSLALWITYGVCMNLKRPRGQLKMRSLKLSSSTLICQKVFEASSFVKYYPPTISWNMSVAVGRQWFSLLIVLFRFRESKQTRWVQLGFLPFLERKPILLVHSLETLCRAESFIAAPVLVSFWGQMVLCVVGLWWVLPLGPL